MTYAAATASVDTAGRTGPEPPPASRPLPEPTATQAIAPVLEGSPAMQRVRVLFLSALACLLVAGPVAAAKPAMEKVPINDVGFLDPFFTAECGFDVFSDVVGHITFRTKLDAQGNPRYDLNNYALRVRIYSEWGSLRAVDVGADRVTFHEDGSVTITTIGNVQSLQIPGIGRVHADVGQVTVHVSFPDPEGEPVVDVLKVAGKHSESFPIAAFCEALAP